MILLVDSEGPDKIAWISDLGLSCRHMHEDTFPHGAAPVYNS